jgi:hypothetical protein
MNGVNGDLLAGLYFIEQMNGVNGDFLAGLYFRLWNKHGPVPILDGVLITLVHVLSIPVRGKTTDYGQVMQLKKGAVCFVCFFFFTHVPSIPVGGERRGCGMVKHPSCRFT